MARVVVVPAYPPMGARTDNAVARLAAIAATPRRSPRPLRPCGLGHAPTIKHEHLQLSGVVLGGTAMDTFGVKFQSLISVATEMERAAAEEASDKRVRTNTVASDEPSHNATSSRSIPNASAYQPTKPTEDSRVEHAVGNESAMPATGLWSPVHAPQRALPVHRVTGTREVGNDSAMARYAAGDDMAFGELYDGLAPLVMAYLRRRTRDRCLVEDLVQETFLRIHLHRGRYKRDAPVLPWALTIAAHLLANRVRGTRRATATFSDDDQASDGAVETTSPEQWAIGMELVERIEQELLRLPSADREAFDMVKRKGLPLKIAAPRLSMTTLALKMRIFRVCGRLRRLISRVGS